MNGRVLVGVIAALLATTPLVEARTLAPSPTVVRQAQRKLNDMHFDVGNADGIVGPRTRAAIEAFQRANGLRVTGRLDPETIAALNL
jgi:localization factor PodJL